MVTSRINTNSMLRVAGYADRATLTRNIQNIQTQEPRLVLEALRNSNVLNRRSLQRHLTSNGITEDQFDLTRFDQRMLSRFIKPKDLASTNIPDIADGVFRSPGALSRAATNPSSTFSYGLYKIRSAASGVATKALAATSAVGITTAMIASQPGSEAMIAHPYLGTALGLTALGYLAWKTADKLPPGGALQRTADVLKSKVLPLAIVADTALMTGILTSTNFSLENLSSMFAGYGLLGYSDGLVGAGAGLAYLIINSLRNDYREFLNAYGGKLNPGTLGREATMLFSAGGSLLADKLYLAARFALTSVAAVYIGRNTFHDPELAKVSTMLIPMFFAIVRNTINKYPGLNNMLSKALGHGIVDHLRKYGTLYGTALGLAGALGIGINERDPYYPIAFATFWGSFSSMFLNELHGIFHSVNSNNGVKLALKASTVDIMGSGLQKRLVEKANILLMNPHTGTNEHTIGFLFSTILSRKPGLSYVVCYDRILESRTGDFVGNAEQDRLFINWVESIQSGIYDRLLHIRGGSTHDRYQSLAENLRELADYFESDAEDGLKTILRHQMGTNRWVEKDVEEFYRACYLEMDLRAKDFRDAAERLDRKVEAGMTSDEDFYGEWSHFLGCYDPDLMTKTPVARKAVRGDEREVRKVENVANIPLFRGLTMHRHLYNEYDGQRYPTEDWIPGTWTRVPNPNFRYDAAPGTMSASKYVWIEARNVLTPLQREYGDCLSTSPIYSHVDNDPEEQHGFTQGRDAIELTLNETPVEVDRYYYVSGNDQGIVPEGIRIRRQGIRETESDLGMQTIDSAFPQASQPMVFTIQPFDYAVMVDKNDVQLRSYSLEPAILEREFQRRFLNIIYRYPFGRDIVANNPHPTKPVKRVSVVDANLELCYQGLVIPWKSDRGATHEGPLSQDQANGFKWQNLSRALVTRIGGQTTRVELEYGDKRVEINRSRWPQYLESLGLPANGERIVVDANNFTKPGNPQREGDMHWIKISYEDGTVAFARTTNRPYLLETER